MNIFVPGRICLFGEHSDWAGGHRRTNAEIEKGYTIIAGTNQGIHAEVKPHPSKLVLYSTMNDGTREGPFSVPMEPAALLTEAQKGGFFSYAAGVAYQILTHYRVRGLKIDNHRTDLPIKKGLSSSAAICVMVARAFNCLYDLKMTVRGEMEYAYLGEVTTPSRCGRMDQGCAYGNRPILMTFDGDRIDVRELSVPRDLHFVVVDLRAGKDTREILNRLNHCYPFADDEVSRGVQEYLGPVNARITHEAADALRKGDAERVGALMREAQSEFDKRLLPACPSQLTAPVLHRVLSFAPIQPYVLGGKGVGSGGDGSAQFVVRDEESQERVVEIIERELHMPCLKLTLCAGRRVRKALIPAAGFGTRLFPATKAMKKELFPIVDGSGRAKPVILAIVEEALSAGIEEVGIIVQARDRELFEQVFYMPPSVENFNKLSREDQEYCGYLMEIGRHVTFITQEAQEGFGHAVYAAREWVGDAPFLLMLGDHLYISETELSCSRQLIEIYERVGQSVVGLKVTPEAAIQDFGCVAGLWEEPNSLLSVTEVYEKPSLQYAREHLHVEGVEEGSFLSLFGQYVLVPRIFDYLAELIRNNVRERGEFQLAPCLDRLRREQGMSGYMVKGERFDIGTADSYREAVINYRIRGACRSDTGEANHTR